MIEERLRPSTMPYTYATEQDERRVIVSGVFRVTPAISANIRFEPDYHRQVVEVTLRNVDRFESVSLEFGPDKLDEARARGPAEVRARREQRLPAPRAAGRLQGAARARQRQRAGVPSRSAPSRPRAYTNGTRTSNAASTAASSTATTREPAVARALRVASSAAISAPAAALRLQPLVDQPRQLRQRATMYGVSSAQAPLERAPADLLVHPPLEERLGGHPQVEVGVELAAEPLDVEQRLLQQHELRLDLDVEAARRAEQLQQHLAERDLLQRPVEDRLAHDADLALQLVDARVGRHPSRLDVRGGDAPVVAAEEREEVLREIALVALRQRAHDAEVERDVLAEVGARRRATKMLPGCMSAWKNPSRNTCVKKISTPARASRGTSMPAARELVDAPDRDARHALHDQHLAAVHQSQCTSGTSSSGELAEVAAQLRAVGRLAHEVELVVRSSSRTRRRPRAAAAACRPTTAVSTSSRAVCISAEVLRRSPRAMFGRSTLTATGVPSGSSARCTCATDALATGVAIERREHLVDRPAVDALERRDAPARTGTAARGPAASRARRRCRSAAGRGRVDSIWPNLTKIGPRSSSARRSRTARGATGRART